MPVVNSVTLTAGSPVVSGYLTSFVGAEDDLLILSGGRAYPILSVDSTTQITLKWGPDAPIADETRWYIHRIGPASRSVVTVNQRVTTLLAGLEAGMPFRVNASGTLAARSAHDAQAQGYVYLRTDGTSRTVYVKLSAAVGDWSAALPFQGERGWSPSLAVVADGERRVLQVTDWTGGEGTKPGTGYLGATGIVTTIAGALDIRGPAGPPVTAGSIGTAELANDAVTNAKLANMAQATLKGRASGAGTGDPQDLTPTQAKTLLAIGTGDVSGLQNALDGKADRVSGLVPNGQCRLVLSAGNLKLERRNGNRVIINGVPETVPSAGVTLAAAGLAADTTYFIYAWMSAGTMTLEASTTGHAPDAGTGNEIKSGDATRSLVGVWRTVTGPAWSAVPTEGASWFNRRPKTARSGTINTSTQSTNMLELPNAARLGFVTFAGEDVRAAIQSNTGNTVAAQNSHTDIGLDGTAAQLPSAAVVRVTSSTSNDSRYVHAATTISPSEGYHYVTPLGSTTGGTASWSNLFLEVTIQG